LGKIGRATITLVRGNLRGNLLSYIKFLGLMGLRGPIKRKGKRVRKKVIE
jgi:hypothetical protein